MPRQSSKLKLVKKEIRDVSPKSEPAGPLGPKLPQPRNPAILPENTQAGIKKQVKINVPGVKTR